MSRNIALSLTHFPNSTNFTELLFTFDNMPVNHYTFKKFLLTPRDHLFIELSIGVPLLPNLSKKIYSDVG